MKTLSPIPFLLQRGLGTCPGAEMTGGADWREVFELTELHGVGSICVDGFQAAAEEMEMPELADGPLADDYFQWLFGVMVSEETHSRQWAAAVKLSDALAANGIKTLVFKGFALGRFYPHPQHRTSCDMDCYLLGSDGLCACEAGNAVAEQAGFECDRSYYKNSKLTGHGLVVENHRFLLPVRGSRKVKKLEKRLEAMLAAAAAGGRVEGLAPGASGALEPIDGSSLLAPPGPFDAVFVLAHALNHFLSEGITLRHVCDWAMVLRAHARSVDWEWWKALCRDNDLLRFGYALSRVAMELCAVPLPFELDGPEAGDPAAADRLLEAILAQRPAGASRAGEGDAGDDRQGAGAGRADGGSSEPKGAGESGGRQQSAGVRSGARPSREGGAGEGGGSSEPKGAGESGERLRATRGQRRRRGACMLGKRIALVHKYFAGSWKFRRFTATTALAYAFRRVCGFFFDRH